METRDKRIQIILHHVLTPTGSMPPSEYKSDIPQVESVKYLGINFYRRVTWKAHVTAKRKQLDLKAGEIKWIIGSHSPLSLENKTLIYKTILKPVWTYGIELWGCASNSNIEIIQRYQSKLLRLITSAQWYVTNRTLHSDLHIPYVREVFLERIADHRNSITSHPNPLVAPLLRSRTTRPLKRRWTFEELL